jgi:serine/threonine-protein kinase
MDGKFKIDLERWLAVSPYLDRALETPTAQRDAWLRELESSEPRMAVELRHLLAAEITERFGSFLSGQALEPPRDVQHARSGEIIGNYRVLNEIGRGGMALVYLAERADDHFDQQVALKILRFGPESGEAQRRFAQERQILASLNHPAIARLIDGGITASGVPYLAMDYVDGMPIDRYCDEKRLSIEDRLRLFVKVAEAVQHAHRHLIVHRDLKPSNIVVTPEGAAKLLDFGIAKLLRPDTMAHAAPPTRDVGGLMTPEYSSPEQVRGDPITTATDIYQLGLLLYELVTGQAPYDVRSRTPIEAMRVICESEPVRPSAAMRSAQAAPDSARAMSLAAISAARSTTPDRLPRQIGGDLDAILLAALRKEPERRYASVGQFAEDIVRYLQGLPVLAYKGVWAYRAGKFIRRNIAGVTMASAAVCALVLVIAWYTSQLANERDRAELQALRARREAATVSQVSEFLASVFRGADSRVARGDTTARELLDRGAARIETELANQPEVQGRLLNVIGDVYVQYDLNDKAQPLLERALLQNTGLFGAMSTEVADTKQSLAKLARNRGDLDKALQDHKEALDILERTLGPNHVATADELTEQAYTVYLQGKSQEAIRTAERAIDIYTRSVGKDDERTLNAMNTLAGALYDNGELRRARVIFEQLVPKMERIWGPEHRRLAAALANLASVKNWLGDYEGNEQLLLRAIAIFKRIYGPFHGTITIGLNNLGDLYFDTGRFREAIATYEGAIATQRQVSGPGHPREGLAHDRIGRVLHSLGDLRGALSQHQSALKIYRESGETSHPNYAAALQDYGELELERNHPSAAEQALRETLTILRSGRKPDHDEIASALVTQGMVLTRMGNPGAAEIQIREAIPTLQRALPPQHHELAAAIGALGESLFAQGKVSEAEPLLLDSASRLKGQLHYQRRVVLERLIRFYELQHNAESAQRFRNELGAFERSVRAAASSGTGGGLKAPRRS